LQKKYPSVKKDIGKLAEQLKIDPKMGIPLGNSCYKIRMQISSKGQGKSGGARVVTYVWISEHSVFLLSIFDKSEAESISDKDLSERLKKLGK
jgi:hypothetical protein